MLEQTRRKCLDIRNRIYPEEAWPATLYEQIIESLGSAEAVLLEVGCGRDADQLSRTGAHFGLSIGLDLQIARQADSGSGKILLCADGHYLPVSSHSVDVVVNTDVVEHLADPQGFFTECRRVLKPGGRLVIATVNKLFPPIAVGRLLPHRLRQLVNGAVSGTKSEDTFPAYYRANTTGALTRFACNAGLQPVRIRYVGHHPSYFMFSTAVYRIAVCFEQFTRRHQRLGFLRNFVHGVFAAPGGERVIQKSEDSNIQHGRFDSIAQTVECSGVGPANPEEHLQ